MFKLARLLRTKVRRIFRTESRDDSIILIYTMGKVGSTTVYESLKRTISNGTIYHVHFLSDHYLQEVLPGLAQGFQHQIAAGRRINDAIADNPDRRLKIITMVREPIIRDVSDIFQNWQTRGENIESFDFSMLQSRIDRMDHAYTLNWFDLEFRNRFGFDIYSKEFNKERGWSIYNLPFADILCLKLESLKNGYPDAMKQFLQCRPSLGHSNKSDDKMGSDLYEQIPRPARTLGQFGKMGNCAAAAL